MRVSRWIVRSLSAQAVAKRNLSNWIGRFLYPYQVSRTRMGPRESNLIAIEATRRSGEKSRRPRVAAAMSTIRSAAGTRRNTGRTPPWARAELAHPLGLRPFSPCNATTPPCPTPLQVGHPYRVGRSDGHHRRYTGGFDTYCFRTLLNAAPARRRALLREAKFVAKRQVPSRARSLCDAENRQFERTRSGGCSCRRGSSPPLRCPH